MNLPAIASETHEKAVAYFKVAEQYGYKFIMEVKKIRDDRLYKEIGFSSFNEYCEKAWKVDRSYIDQRIVIAESLGNENDFEDTYPRLGHSKSLMLARMEPEVRQQIETTIDVNQATVKALKLAEQKIKEKETEIEKANTEKYHFQKLLNQEKSKPGLTVTKTVEVVPESIKKQLEDLKFQNTNLSHGYQDAKEKLQSYELRNTDDFNEEAARKQREKLQHEADLSTIQLCISFKQFVEKAAFSSYVQGAIAHSNAAEKNRLEELVESAQAILDQTKLALRGRKLGVVNEQKPS